jgi:hypothetical protein
MCVKEGNEWILADSDFILDGNNCDDSMMLFKK